MVRGVRVMPSYSMTRRRRASVQRSTVRCRKRGLPKNAFGENGLRIGEARLPFPDSARTRRWKRRRAGTPIVPSGLRSRRRYKQRCPAFRSTWAALPRRSEEHTSELQSLMRISYAVFCLKKKKNVPPPDETKSIHHTHVSYTLS